MLLRSPISASEKVIPIWGFRAVVSRHEADPANRSFSRLRMRSTSSGHRTRPPAKAGSEGKCALSGMNAPRRAKLRTKSKVGYKTKYSVSTLPPSLRTLHGAAKACHGTAKADALGESIQRLRALGRFNNRTCIVSRTARPYQPSVPTEFGRKEGRSPHWFSSFLGALYVTHAMAEATVEAPPTREHHARIGFFYLFLLIFFVSADVSRADRVRCHRGSPPCSAPTAALPSQHGTA